MDLKELLKKREKAIELKTEKETLRFTLTNYKDTTFVLKVPNANIVLVYLKKMGIKDFSLNQEALTKMFIEKLSQKSTEVPTCEFIFNCFVEPNFTELASELMVELKVKSRTEILKSFFNFDEITEILTLVIKRVGENFNSTQKQSVVELKKK